MNNSKRYKLGECVLSLEISMSDASYTLWHEDSIDFYTRTIVTDNSNISPTTQELQEDILQALARLKQPVSPKTVRRIAKDILETIRKNCSWI